jgi:septal ring factor EnvC (AmiA/AmiB activator)
MPDNTTEKPNNTELKLDLILARLQNLETKFSALEAAVDDRLKDTRPLWQVVISRFEGIEAKLESMDAKLTDAGQQLRAIGNQLTAFARENKNIQGEQIDQSRRLDEIERRRA